jgi:hypothetical protein
MGQLVCRYTEGLEDRVGSKTTFRLVNSKWTEFREFKDEIVLWWGAVHVRESS